MEDWEQTRDRLAQYLSGRDPSHYERGVFKSQPCLQADIRAALARVDHYEASLGRATEWIKEHLPDTPSGSFILDVLRQRVEELERALRAVHGDCPGWISVTGSAHDPRCDGTCSVGCPVPVEEQEQCQVCAALAAERGE